jgi:hypothetical protein
MQSWAQKLDYVTPQLVNIEVSFLHLFSTAFARTTPSRHFSSLNPKIVCLYTAWGGIYSLASTFLFKQVLVFLATQCALVYSMTSWIGYTPNAILVLCSPSFHLTGTRELDNTANRRVSSCAVLQSSRC